MLDRVVSRPADYGAGINMHGASNQRPRQHATDCRSPSAMEKKAAELLNIDNGGSVPKKLYDMVQACKTDWGEVAAITVGLGVSTMGEAMQCTDKTQYGGTDGERWFYQHDDSIEQLLSRYETTLKISPVNFREAAASLEAIMKDRSTRWWWW